MWSPYNNRPMSTEVLRAIRPDRPRLNLYNLLDVPYIVLSQVIIVLYILEKFVL